jgi:hypothetical protein
MAIISVIMDKMVSLLARARETTCKEYFGIFILVENNNEFN